MRQALTIIGTILLALVMLVGIVGVWAYQRYVFVEPLSESERSKLSPDWYAVTHGNWSPWWDPGDGKVIWNPAASYNEWVANLPNDNRMAKGLTDLEYEHRKLLESDSMYFLKSLPDDPERWARLEPALALPESDELLDQLLLFYNRPVMGAWWTRFDTTPSDVDPDEYAAAKAALTLDPASYDPGEFTYNPEENKAAMAMALECAGRSNRFHVFVMSKSAYELKHGHTERFVESLEGMLLASDLVPEIPMLIAQLIDASIDSDALFEIDWALRTHPDLFDDAQLARLDHAIAQHIKPTFIWEGEYLALDDMLRRLCDANGHFAPGKVRLFLDGLIDVGEPVSMPEEELGVEVQRVLTENRKLIESASRRVDLSRRPEPLRNMQERVLAMKHFGRYGKQMLMIMTASYDDAAERMRTVEQQSIGVRVGIAALRHQLRHGELPASIDEIDDDLIGFEPIDGYTGNPVGYTRTAQGPLVYSFGPDGVDDHGVAPGSWYIAENGERYHTDEGYKWLKIRKSGLGSDQLGDWVLFPSLPIEPSPLSDSELHKD